MGSAWGDHHHEMLAVLADEPQDIPGVVNQLRGVQEILGRIPPMFDENPIADFNRLYTTITETIGELHEKGTFGQPDFLSRLDVEFARLYVAALRSWGTDRDRTPESWAVLFSRIADKELKSLPCAVAGVNAHINFDLPFAVFNTWKLFGPAPAGSSQHRDYLLVNDVFEKCIPGLRRRYLEGWQRHLDRINLGFDDWYQNLLVAFTRKIAWDRAEHLWALRLDTASLEASRREFDRQAARIGRALLSPFCKYLQ